jgi:hypothetical protein
VTVPFGVRLTLVDFEQAGTDGIHWAVHRRELAAFVAYVLLDPDIAAELKASGIPATEVVRAVADRPELLARYRATLDPDLRFDAVRPRRSRRQWRL